MQGFKQHIHRNSKAGPEREQFKFVAYFLQWPRGSIMHVTIHVNACIYMSVSKDDSTLQEMTLCCAVFYSKNGSG